MLKQRGSASSGTKPTERRSEDVDCSPITNRIIKVQKEEYLIKNACCSPAKYYLCKQNNKRSLLGRKQRNQVVRSFPNRYQYSYTKKVTCLFSIRYILIIILESVLFFYMYLFLNRVIISLLLCSYRKILILRNRDSLHILLLNQREGNASH